MTNSKTSELVAKRWANALVELVQENNEISAEKVLEDLKSVQATIVSSEELKNVISNPSISTEEKQIVICKLFNEKIMPIVYNFIFVLNLRKRMTILSDIIDCFEKDIEKINNITRVGVTSAINIDEDKKNDIKSKISEKLNKDVILDWTVDEDIIAGLVFNINDTVFDNSIKNKLDKLSKMIIKG